MQRRELYHGTDGDSALAIARFGQIRPNAEGRIYFSEWSYESVLMHGADLKRKATFALKLRVDIPDDASLQRTSTAGVQDSLIVLTAQVLSVEAVILYVREPRSPEVRAIDGVIEIIKFLSH
jgi:hypothetical protein